MKQCECGCGKAARTGGRLSAACYMRKYRKTSTGQAATKQAQKRWSQKHGKWWNTEYKRIWRARRHFYVPEEIHELRQAIKRLERALAYSNQRERIRGSGESVGDDGPE